MSYGKGRPHLDRVIHGIQGLIGKICNEAVNSPLLCKTHLSLAEFTTSAVPSLVPSHTARVIVSVKVSSALSLTGEKFSFFLSYLACALSFVTAMSWNLFLTEMLLSLESTTTLSYASRHAQS